MLVSRIIAGFWEQEQRSNINWDPRSIRMKGSREDERNHETIGKHEQEERPRKRSSEMHTALPE